MKIIRQNNENWWNFIEPEGLLTSKVDQKIRDERG